MEVDTISKQCCTLNSEVRIFDLPVYNMPFEIS